MKMGFPDDPRRDQGGEELRKLESGDELPTKV